MTRQPRDMIRVERRISAAVCVGLCAAGVGIQIASTLLLTAFLREKAGYVYLLLEAAAIVNAVWVYQRPGSPSFKLAWMCLLMASPVAGMILFWLWNGIRQAKTLRMKHAVRMLPDETQRRECAENLRRLRQCSPGWGRLAAYLQTRGYWLRTRTETRYFPDGAVFFTDLISRLEQAERYIFLEYYIIAEGEIWDRVLTALKNRVSAGVEAYIIFDDFGNLFRMSGRTIRAVQDAGIQLQMFNRVHRSVNRMAFNYRNHRKLAVIDGVTAYTGGINLADEYANLTAPYGHWKDSGIRLDGEGVRDFTAQFIRMWKMLGRTFPRPDAAYFPDSPDVSDRTTLTHDSPDVSDMGKEPSGSGADNGKPSGSGDGFCQPFSDGPIYSPDNSIEQIYLQFIYTARRLLYLTTPYYAVEASVQEALCAAADAGVDVRLCVPAAPDHPAPYLVAETYWEELLRHGVKIYRYTPGFLHAKSVLADCEAALIGTTNMDYRSFRLNYECGVLCYHMPIVEDLLADLLDIMAHSTPYTLEEWGKRPWWRRVIASVVKLGAIWL